MVLLVCGACLALTRLAQPLVSADGKSSCTSAMGLNFSLLYLIECGPLNTASVGRGLCVDLATHTARVHRARAGVRSPIACCAKQAS